MRVFQGVTGQAGQPGTLAAGLRKIGIAADSITIRDHAFGYGADRRFSTARVKSLSDVDGIMQPLILDYDVFHFHAQSLFTIWPNLDSPSFQDIFILKMHGKKVFFHFRGQEIRNSQKFKELNPYHYVDEPSGYLFQKMPDKSKDVLRSAMTDLCDGVFVVDEELQTYVPDAEIVPRTLDAEAWGFVGVGETDVPVVVHAPSRRGVKGTQHVLDALDALRGEGVKFELRLVEQMNHAEAREVYRSADIIVDQLRIGWYGVLAVEALALGKPVISHIRDDLWAKRGGDLPILNANPDTVRDVLRDAIRDNAMRRALATRARAYFDRVHASTVVARQLAAIYERPYRAPRVAGYLALLDHQQKLLGRPATAGFDALRPRNRAARLVHEFLRLKKAEGSAAALRAARAWVARRL